MEVDSYFKFTLIVNIFFAQLNQFFKLLETKG